MRPNIADPPRRALRADCPTLPCVKPHLSIVIPLGPGETAWRALLQDLQTLPPDVELILVGVDALAPAELDADSGALAGRLRWLSAARGRARQQNAGAQAARGRWLCFLHADSRLEADALRALASLPQRPPALYFFDLGFFDGPVLLRLNALGANLRSRLLDLPFGDQGLCLPRVEFERLGGFDESLPRAEDHALVWAARRAGLRLRPLGARLLTSGRRYREAGWWRTTARFVALSLRQAWAFSRNMRS
jgi:hypothetical protein